MALGALGLSRRRFLIGAAAGFHTISQGNTQTLGGAKNGLGVAHSVSDFGAKGDGATDDTSSIQSALDTAQTYQKSIVYFPPGRFLISSSLSVGTDFVTLKGSGWRTTTIVRTSDFGDSLIIGPERQPSRFINACNIDGLSFRSLAETRRGAHIRLSNLNHSHFTNLSIEDHFGGIDLSGVLDCYFTNLHIFSDRAWSARMRGSYLMRVRSGPLPRRRLSSEIFIVNLNARGLTANGFTENGVVVNAVDGLWISNGHTLRVYNAGVLVSPETSASQITGLMMSNFWFDGYGDYGLAVEGNTRGAFGVLMLSNCQYLNSYRNGIFVSAGCNVEGVNCSGGSVLKAGGSGIQLNGGSVYSFSSLLISGNGRAFDNAAGLEVGPNVSNVALSGGFVGGRLLGSNKPQKYGVRIHKGFGDNISVVGTIFQGNEVDVFDESEGRSKIFQFLPSR